MTPPIKQTTKLTKVRLRTYCAFSKKMDDGSTDTYFHLFTPDETYEIVIFSPAALALIIFSESLNCL
ncbi:hypothetical protein D3C73_721200 [compost metagenome]